MKKICRICERELPIELFFKRRDKRVEGEAITYRSECKVCCGVRSAKYQNENPDRKKEYSRKYRKNNLEVVQKREEKWRLQNPAKMRAFRKKWEDNNTEKRRTYLRDWGNNKYHTDVSFNVRNRMSGLIRNSLKGIVKKKRWESLVDYSKVDLVRQLQKTMPKGYTWNDYLNGNLHIDHIIPVTAFNITDERCMDFKYCWSLKNLRLLPAHDNLVKHAKLDRPFQPSLGIAL
jgi:hypothetical protein